MAFNTSLARFLLLLGIVILSLSFISAETDTQIVDSTYKINSKVNYAKPCINNGTYCSSNAVCNFTIYKPNNNLLLNNYKGTNRYYDHNVSFYVDEIGIYTSNMICCDQGSCGSETFYFEVTGSGYNNINTLLFIALIISFGLILLGFYIRDAWITILGSIVLFLIGLFVLINGIDGIRSLTMTRGISFVLIGMAAYISIRSAFEIIND